MSGDEVVLLSASIGPRRSWWDWAFDGTVVPAPHGSRLTGTVGAPRLTLVFGVCWCAACAGFFVLLAASGISRLASHGATGADLVHLAGALVPLGFLGGYLALAVVATRVASRAWVDVDALVRGWLGVPAAPEAAGA